MSRSLQAFSPRWTLRVPVTSLDGTPTQWRCEDLSEGGMFICGQPMLPVGSPIGIRVRFADGKDFESDAVVRWVREKRKDALRPAGMGIQFSNLTPEQTERVLAQIRSITRAQVSMPQSAPLSDASQADLMDEAAFELLYEEPIPLTDLIEDGTEGSADVDTADTQHDQRPRPTLRVGEQSIKTPAPRPGTILGNYRVIAQLGSGAMGDVYSAEHRMLNRKVAIKMLSLEHNDKPEVVRRFFDEGRLVNAVSHPNVVEITDFVPDGDYKFYVMELLVGETLLDLLEREGALPLERTCHIAFQIADALHAVHDAGVVHRDLKPANVMLIKKRSQRDFVKLLDFGIAKSRVISTQQTMAGMILGTPAYMSPEQIAGARVTGEADIYALGVILFMMLTGEQPFRDKDWVKVLMMHAQKPAPDPRTIVPKLPKSLATLVTQCLAKTPAERPNHDVLRTVFESFLD